jgi:putative endonuclease
MVGSEAFIAVYIMASRPHGTLYIGVTSDLVQRAAQHREGTLAGFTERYGVKRLVWFEQHDTIVEAIRREKPLKKYKRDWKINLIEQANPEWLDLYPGLQRDPGYRPDFRVPPNRS